MRRESVVFGHMHEDHSVELMLAARTPSERCLVIASGGELALSLAGAGRSVLAVDSNAAQIALVRLKIALAGEVGARTVARWVARASPEVSMRADSAGLDSRSFAHGLCFCGSVDWALRFVGPFIAWILHWPAMCPGLFRQALSAFFQRLLPIAIRALHGRSASSAVNSHSIALMKRRLLLTMSKTDAGRNPLLASTLGRGFGQHPPHVWQEAGISAWSACAESIELRHSSVEAALKGTPPGTFGMISLSNLPDLLDPTTWRKLLASAGAALVPGGFIIARSMLRETLSVVAESEITDVTASALSECGDSSPLCPVVWVGRRRESARTMAGATERHVPTLSRPIQ